MLTATKNTIVHHVSGWTFVIRAHAVEVRDGSRTVDRFILSADKGSDYAQCAEWVAFAQSYYPGI